MSLSAQMSAGYSFENGLKESLLEMNKLFGNNSIISRELQIIINQGKLSIPVEKSFEEFGRRTLEEDIELFADILKIAKRSGGDLIVIIRKTADSIVQKNDTEREIETIINEKRYEKNVMNMIPLLMVFYVKLTSPAMMEIMYKTIAGNVIMTICLCLYMGAVYIGEKITDIRV